MTIPKTTNYYFLQQKSWAIGENLHKDGTGQEKVSLGTFGLPEILADRDKKVANVRSTFFWP